MAETIETKFDLETIPEGAQNMPEVVALAKRDLAYRCDVCRFWGTPGYRARLIDIAKAAAYGPDRNEWPR